MFKERTSPFSSFNYYNLLLSNLPSWKKYPPRNRSLICSLDYHSAENYGDAQYVFPVDGSKVGVCPEADIWLSFQNVQELDDLNWQITTLIEASGLREPKTWNEVQKCFMEIDKKRDDIVSKLADDDEKDSRTFYNAHTSRMNFFTHDVKYFYTKNTLMEALEEALDPTYNKFKLVKVGDPVSPDRSWHEVWTDGVSILMPVNTKFQDIFEERFGWKLEKS